MVSCPCGCTGCTDRSPRTGTPRHTLLPERGMVALVLHRAAVLLDGREPRHVVRHRWSTRFCSACDPASVSAMVSRSSHPRLQVADHVHVQHAADVEPLVGGPGGVGVAAEEAIFLAREGDEDDGGVEPHAGGVGLADDLAASRTPAVPSRCRRRRASWRWCRNGRRRRRSVRRGDSGELADDVVGLEVGRVEDRHVV